MSDRLPEGKVMRAPMIAGGLVATNYSPLTAEGLAHLEAHTKDIHYQTANFKLAVGRETTAAAENGLGSRVYPLLPWRPERVYRQTTEDSPVKDNFALYYRLHRQKDLRPSGELSRASFDLNREGHWFSKDKRAGMDAFFNSARLEMVRLQLFGEDMNQATKGVDWNVRRFLELFGLPKTVNGGWSIRELSNPSFTLVADLSAIPTLSLRSRFEYQWDRRSYYGHLGCTLEYNPEDDRYSMETTEEQRQSMKLYEFHNDTGFKYYQREYCQPGSVAKMLGAMVSVVPLLDSVRPRSEVRDVVSRQSEDLG